MRMEIFISFAHIGIHKNTISETRTLHNTVEFKKNQIFLMARTYKFSILFYFHHIY